MKSNNKGFTLAEMIISVAILSIVSVYILQMFIATKNLSTKSYEIDKSLRISKNIIELISAGEKISKNSTNELISSMELNDGVYTLNFDKNFEITNEEDRLYTLNMKLTQEDGLNYIDIECVRLKPYILKDEKNIQISSVNSVKRAN